MLFTLNFELSRYGILIFCYVHAICTEQYPPTLSTQLATETYELLLEAAWIFRLPYHNRFFLVPAVTVKATVTLCSLFFAFLSAQIQDQIGSACSI